MARKKILISVEIQSKSAEVAVDKVVGSLNKLEDAQVRVSKSTNKARAQSGLNNAILLETSRLASDASFGFTAIANNLSQVITLFQSFARTNGGFVKSLRLLIGQILGPAGILIGIQLLISFGDKIIKFFKGSASAAEEEKERLKELNDEIEKNIELRRTQLSELEKAFGVLTSKITMDALGNMTKEIVATQEELMELSDRFKDAGIKNAEMLKDEEISLQNRVQIAKEMMDIFRAETNLKGLRQEFDKKLRQGDIDGARIVKDMILSSQKEILTSQKIIDKLTENNVTKRDKNLKTLAEMSKFEATELFKFIEENEKHLDLVLERIFKRRGEKSLEAIMQEISLAIMAEEQLKEVGVKSEEEFLQFAERHQKKQEAITKGQEIETKTRLRIQQTYTRSLGEFGDALRNLGFLSDEFKIASLVAEKAEKISQIVIQTKQSNTAIDAITSVQSALGIPGAKLRGQALKTKNNIASGINIAAIVAQAATGIRAIKSKGNVPTSIGGGAEGGEAPPVQAPDFNVVGTGGASQLASGLAAVTGRPLKAFVVSKEISSAQELDRNITNNAQID